MYCIGVSVYHVIHSNKIKVWFTNLVFPLYNFVFRKIMKIKGGLIGFSTQWITLNCTNVVSVAPMTDFFFSRKIFKTD